MFVSLFLCWVISFQTQNETSKLSPEEASILAAYLRNTRLRGPHHQSPAALKAYNQFSRGVGQVLRNKFL